MKIKPDETELVGKWITENGQVRADSVCERIQWLVSKDLRKISISSQWGAWETLFQDTNDGRYWEKTYPQGEMQGGGPPQLRCISINEAKSKYGDIVNS